MASTSSPEQPSGPEPGLVLCDNCKNSVLEPSQDSENVSLRDTMHQVITAWSLSPRFWPIGYIIASPYSPFRVEQELPKRDWRNAFEDLLALDSGGEMISHESRKQETAVADKLRWERAYQCIEKLNKLNARDAPSFTRVQTALSSAKSQGRQADPAVVSWLEKKINEARKMAQRRVAIAESFKADEAAARDWSASRQKDRGQWIASLITSGALRGWGSRLRDSEHGDLINLFKVPWAPENEDQVDFTFTEREVQEHFEDGRPFEITAPGPPLYKYEISYQPPAIPADDFIDEKSSASPPPEIPTLLSRTPERPCFWGQVTAAERIELPNGKMGTRVVMKNYLTNGDVEEKVIVQEPGKVLQEVEKARALIEDRMLGLDKPI